MCFLIFFPVIFSCSREGSSLPSRSVPSFCCQDTVGTGREKTKAGSDLIDKGELLC